MRPWFDKGEKSVCTRYCEMGRGRARQGEKWGKKSKMRIIQSVSPALCSHSLFFSIFSPVFIPTKTDLEFLTQISAGTSLSFVLSPHCAPHFHHGLRSHLPHVFYTVPLGSGNLGHFHPPSCCVSTPALPNNVLSYIGPSAICR